MNKKPVIGVLIGDATGVGPELVAKLAVGDFFTAHCRPILIGDARIFQRGLSIVGGAVPCQIISGAADADWSKGLPFLDTQDQDPAQIPLAQMSAEAGRSVNRQLLLACELCRQGSLEGFVFAPFNKSAMIEGGCPFESEHHLMADFFGVTGPFGEINVLGKLMTTRTTSHIPIKAVSDHLTEERILGAIELLYNTIGGAGVPEPRIAVCALNPHAGEGGRCGREEIDVIAPAIQRASSSGRNVKGPFPADVLFIKAFQEEYDGVVTMYHDQGQIALKLKGFDQGITVAGGQPYPIVTCAHGTAYDITGTGKVLTGAFENAVKMASRMAAHRIGGDRMVHHD